MFSIFINEVATKIKELGRHGVQFMPGLIEQFIILFADDIALMSSTAQGLQHQLNLLYNMCNQLALEINTAKTKVMVFRKGGFLGRNEKWYLGQEEVEVVKKFVYLGFTFTTSMTMTQNVKTLALKGKKAAYELVRVKNKLEVITKEIYFKIFDTQI